MNEQINRTFRDYQDVALELIGLMSTLRELQLKTGQSEGPFKLLFFRLSAVRSFIGKSRQSLIQVERGGDVRFYQLPELVYMQEQLSPIHSIINYLQNETLPGSSSCLPELEMRIVSIEKVFCQIFNGQKSWVDEMLERQNC